MKSLLPSLLTLAFTGLGLAAGAPPQDARPVAGSQAASDEVSPELQAALDSISPEKLSAEIAP